MGIRSARQTRRDEETDSWMNAINVGGIVPVADIKLHLC